MQTSYRSSFDQAYQFLVDEGPVTPSRLAAYLEIDDSTASRHLKALVAEGLVERTRKGRTVVYTARQNLDITYAGPLGPGSSQATSWGLLQWHSHGTVDWRYPLVTRVPDRSSQMVLMRLLDHCNEQGIFHPWLQWWNEYQEARRNRPDSTRRSYDRKITGLANWGHFDFIIFGSCARGDAREGSDMDLLILGPSEDQMSKEVKTLQAPFHGIWQETMKKIIDEMNLGSPRYIDAVFSRDPGLNDLPDGLGRSIRKEGLTIHSTLGTRLRAESWRATPDG